MKYGTPKEIAQYIALYFTLIAGIINVSAFFLFTDGVWPWVYFTGMLVILYFSSLAIVKWAIERFIQRRIKLIYKTIHRMKSKNPVADEVDFSKDIIGGVSKEVAEWAEDNKKEITQLREQEKFRKEFIGNLSHELKTPIFSIQGYLLTLLEGGLEDEQINRKYLERADKNLDRLISLISELEEITKLEAGNKKLNKEPFDPVKLTQDVFSELEYKAVKNNVELKLVDSKVSFKALGDKMKIAQVLTNLIANSIKYGRKEGGKTEVKFFDMDDNILVEVEDNGLGIAAEHLPRLFERFYRVDKSRARHIAGSGLGLAIVKHIVESHGQTINVSSQEGEGSTFSFTLEKAK